MAAAIQLLLMAEDYLSGCRAFLGGGDGNGGCLYCFAVSDGCHHGPDSVIIVDSRVLCRRSRVGTWNACTGIYQPTKNFPSFLECVIMIDF